MDPIRQLEDLLESFNNVIEKCTEYRQDMYQPCAEQHVTKPFVRQEDEFSVHGIGFHYLLRRSLDVEILETNRARALECLELLYNFVETVESKLPFIFIEEEELKNKFIWFPSKISFGEIKEAIEKMRIKKNQNFFKVRFIEGYIGDGKSALLVSKNTFDSELDYFYRSEIKLNSLGFSHMPEVFFRVFALVGIFGAMCNSLIRETELFIDRSWLSHEYFASHLKSRFSIDYHPPAPRTLSLGFFSHVILWTRLFRSLNGWPGDLVLTEDVEFYFRQTPMEYPWPFREHRQMEMDIYKSEQELVIHYKQFYLFLNKYFIKCNNSFQQ